ncbi:MAG: hypothetical protein K0R82_1894 [Flavipsychrobacter sp.]|jgi:hypothetical protein|nr:hypothetical protein [Flavipsychrobacter sp.]
MNFAKLSTLTLAFAGLAAAASAQYGYSHYGTYSAENGIEIFKTHQRASVGYCLNFASATLTQHYRNQIDPPYVEYFGPQVDSTETRTLNTDVNYSWGAVGGMYLPLAKLSSKSILALNIDVAINFMQFNVGETILSKKLGLTEKIVGMNAGVPISIDFKSGGDAVLSKQYRSMFTFGIGANPCMYMMDYGPFVSSDESPFKMIPFVKAEVGIFAGIAFKLRGTAYLGTANYFDATEQNSTEMGPEGERPFDESSVRLVGKNYGYSLALLVMPFSWNWESE